MKITYEGISEIGEREKNEDFIGITQAHGEYCFVLCDGLGGHGFGEVASQYVTEKIIEYFNVHDEDDMLENAIMYAQNALLELQHQKHQETGMKTTLSVLVMNDTHAQWAYVGDSRVYLFHKGKYVSRTLDHSVPQMLALIGDIKEKDIRHHPDRNRLLKVMGVAWAKPQYTIGKKIPLKKGQQFLLCSDGFWEEINEKQMRKCFRKAHDAKEWIYLMADIVKKNGMKNSKEADNYSAIGIWIGDE